MTDGDRAADLLDEFTSAMSTLTATLETDPRSSEVFDAVCAEAVRVIPGADMASITAIKGGTPDTSAYTDVRALEVDRAQYAAGVGPCLRAAETGETVRLSIETASERWPDFVAMAKRIEVRSYLAAPLHVDEQMAGAINLFGFDDHGFKEVDSKLLELFTTVVTFGLRTARRYHDALELAANLEKALQSRAVIEQAKGILMAVHKITETQAIDRLIDHSQRTNVKLRVVAAEFVRTMTTED